MSSNTLIVSDTNYNVPTMERLTQLRRSKPWEMDPEYFKKIQVNASAAVKMLQHALQGVVSGKKATGMSVEVMGLLLGYPNGDSVVVTDCIQLPIEGMFFCFFFLFFFSSLCCLFLTHFLTHFLIHSSSSPPLTLPNSPRP